MRIHLRDISLFVFMRDLTRPDLTLEYIRFQSSGMNVVDYCKSKNLPYLEFVDVVNKWNTRYGIPKVEHCMERAVSPRNEVRQSRTFFVRESLIV